MNDPPVRNNSPTSRVFDPPASDQPSAAVGVAPTDRCQTRKSLPSLFPSKFASAKLLLPYLPCQSSKSARLTAPPEPLKSAGFPVSKFLSSRLFHPDAVTSSMLFGL